MKLGDIIRKNRRLKNHTQKSLAKLIGAERTSIQKYENSTINMSLNRFIKLCDVLEIPPHEIVTIVKGTREIYVT